MFGARLQRPRPHLDDKVLTAWNGLMIAAFARAARQLYAISGGSAHAGEAYLQAARRAAGFLNARMWNAESKTLLRRFRDGHAEIDGYAEDYAFLIFGLLELFQADADPQWIVWAIRLQNRQDELFWDASEGGWFSTTGSDPSVLLRVKEEYDGAEPGASSISVMNLLALAHLVESKDWSDKIERTLKLFGLRLEQLGRAVPMMGAALSTYSAGPSQVVVAGERGADRLLRVLGGRYLPFAMELHLTEHRQAALESILPLLAAMKPVDGAAAAYVCRAFSCRPPALTADALEAELGA
jgi:hypothetical protein